MTYWNDLFDLLVGGAPRGDYVQDERYIAVEHMDVRRDWFKFARWPENSDASVAPKGGLV